MKTKEIFFVFRLVVIFTLLLVNILQGCKFQKIESRMTNSQNNLLDSIANEQNIVSHSFHQRLKIVKSNHEKCITLANLEDGCLLCFNIQDGVLSDSCTFNLISSEIPVYEIYEIDSIYYFSYGYEENVSTEIFSYDSSFDTLFNGYDLNDVKSRLVLLTEANLMDLNSEILLFNVNDKSLQHLDLFGSAIFASSINEFIIAKMDEQGNTSVYQYFLPNSNLTHLFDFKGDLYLLGFNVRENKIYFLGNSRVGIFEYELGSDNFPIKILDKPIYSPFYSELHQSIFYLDDNQKTLFVHRVY